ncbi:MAG: BCCT family transporter [Candidatus Dadabacteria bacterium]|nr:BCCT family transporter [Candidatus Dadabacteria bacterium]MYC39399.1 BCCT family transporter [Candidatus Dadabacteria bacterium]
MKEEKKPARGSNIYKGRAYRRGRDNLRIFGLDLHVRAFLVSALVIVIFVAAGTIFQEETAELFANARHWVVTRFHWLFMSAVNVILVFCLLLIVSPFAKVRLGGRDAKPDYSYASWFAMIFSTSVSAGFLFFGVVEPIHHFQNPPLGIDPSDTKTAFAAGMAGAIFHWGLHGWAIFAVVGLSMALFSYNMGMPFSLRSVFYPVLGNRVWGWSGHLIEALAVFSTLFGIAVSIGLGTEQITGGVDYLLSIPPTDLSKVMVIALVMLTAMTALLTGINTGIGRLSRINIILAVSLMLFIIAAGPTLDILRHCLDSTTTYIMSITSLSIWIGRDDTNFLHEWTIFYWAWWFCYAPFVGMFIARISKGRTVREFLFFVLILPTIFCVLWMNAFGGTAVHQFLIDGYTGVTETVATGLHGLALFKLLETFPLTHLFSLVSIVMLFSFLVVSLDSGSLAVDSITAGGKLNTPVRQREFWCLIGGLIPAVLMLAGGLGSFQAAVIVVSLPLAVLFVVMLFSIWTGLRRELRHPHHPRQPSRKDAG